MDEQAEKKAFANGIANFCADNGLQRFAKPIEKFAFVRESFDMDPKAFADGFQRAIKEAQVSDRKSLLLRLLPWILVPTAIYGASKWGELWGRHAAANGRTDGPISGPVHKMLESVFGSNPAYVGPEVARKIRGDWKSRPMTAEQHARVSQHGTTIDPEAFG